MLNAVIVDDEPLAHDVLLHHLSTHEDVNVVDSKQYEIGVKPTSIPEISVEMDVPTIKQTGAHTSIKELKRCMKRI